MAYYSNGSETSFLDTECTTCAIGKEACPIAFVQIDYNYEQCGNETAKKILDYLVSNTTGCRMKNKFPRDLKTDAKQNKLDF